MDLLGELMDGDIDRRNRWGVRLHLLICRHCRRYAASYRTTLQTERAALLSARDAVGEEEIPDALVTSILDAVDRR